MYCYLSLNCDIHCQWGGGWTNKTLVTARWVSDYDLDSEA